MNFYTISNRRIKAIIFGLALIVFSHKAISQNTNFTWAKQLGPQGSDNTHVNATLYPDDGQSLVVDASENVYTLGTFVGTADFDPGTSTSNLTSAGSTDIFLSKLDANGNFVWTKHFGGASVDDGNAIALDASGNLYIAGTFSGTVDFNPGAGTSNLTSSGELDMFLVKLDANGNFVWAKRIGSALTEEVFSIDLDASGNIYATGYFGDLIAVNYNLDFDPGANVSNLSCSNSYASFVLKLDNTGNFVWVKKIGGGTSSSQVNAYSISIDNSNNIYTTGGFGGTTDFDPGVSTFNLVSSSVDVFISKLDVNGNFIWAKKIGGSNFDQGLSIALDGADNVYTTGYFNGTSDFDPGTGTFNLTSAGIKDIYITKLNASGNFIWAKRFGGTLSDVGNNITFDNSENIYAIGNFSGTVDFDPGSGTFDLTSSGSSDVFISKLDSSGNFLWAKQLGGTGIDAGQETKVTTTGNIYSTGSFEGTADFNPDTGTFNLTSTGTDVFVHKLSNCPTINVSSSTSSPTCSNQTNGSAIINVNGGAPGYNLSWTGTSSGNPTGTEITSSGGSYTISNLGAGTYLVTVTDANGCNTTTTLSITAPSIVSVSSIATNAACNGQTNGSAVITASGGSAGYNVSWTGAATSNPIGTEISASGGSYTMTGLGSGTYNVTVTDINGCSAISTVSISLINNGLSLSATPTACVENRYDLNGLITFTSSPSSDTIIVICSSGSSQTFLAPFGDTLVYTFQNLTANGTNGNVSATFSGSNVCPTVANFISPIPCVCEFLPFCVDSLSYPAGTNESDPHISFPNNNYGCLSTAPNPAWYYMQISQGGSLGLSITNSANVDVDFILYGPYSSLDNAYSYCNNLGNGTSTNTILDCSFSPNSSEIANAPNVQTGEVYVMLLTNYSNLPTNISFQNSGSASTDCSILTNCNISNLTSTSTLCNNGLFSVNGTVNFTNPPSTGDLTISTSSGSSLVFTPPFTNSIDFTISDLEGDGNPLTLYAIFSETNCSDSIVINSPQCGCLLSDSNSDCDGDGVTNGDEVDPDGDGTPGPNGTDPSDPCSFASGSQTGATSQLWQDADCDGDGVTNGDEVDPDGDGAPGPNGTDPSDPCSSDTSLNSLSQGQIWLDADCDGDGVTNGNEIDPDGDGTPGPNGTDPNDPCSSDTSLISLTQGQIWLDADCDGDGVTNGDEVDPDGDGTPGPNGTDPNDPCSSDTSLISLSQGQIWLDADCDGDGVTNGDEVDPDGDGTPGPNGTDPNDPCSLTALTQTGNPNQAWLDSDCDGDGVTNGDEFDPDGDGNPGPNGTDPTNPCSFLLASQNLTPLQTWLDSDCDGDGVTNANEVDPNGDGTPGPNGTDPNDPCSSDTSLISLTQGQIWLDADCDGDGVTNGDEVDPDGNGTPGPNGTDPSDPCSFASGSQSGATSQSWQDADCDGDGVTNGEEQTNGTNPSDPCDPNENYLGCNLDVDVPEGFSPDGDGINDLLVITGIENYPNNRISIIGRWGDEVFYKDNYQNSWNGKANRGLLIGSDELPSSTYFYILDLNGDGTQVLKGYIYLQR